MKGWFWRVFLVTVGPMTHQSIVTSGVTCPWTVICSQPLPAITFSLPGAALIMWLTDGLLLCMAGPYLGDASTRDKFNSSYRAMTEAFMCLPICLPGTDVSDQLLWEVQQAMQCSYHFTHVHAMQP